MPDTVKIYEDMVANLQKQHDQHADSPAIQEGIRGLIEGAKQNLAEARVK